MTHREETVVFAPGRCRFCGCTERSACRLDVDGQVVRCWWLDDAHTICSNPHCVAQAPIGELEKVALRHFSPPNRKAVGS